MAAIPIKTSGRLMQLLIGGVCLVLLLRDHTAGATIPTIDNIVKILQSPVVQQLILPRPLVAADTGFVGGEAADESAPAKPAKKPPKDEKK
uniref:Uncharacterized protein n=1 Tax=Anopheles atroparvus TaxID=41427 RepID=A0AAG5CWQ7_ANOAO